MEKRKFRGIQRHCRRRRANEDLVSYDTDEDDINHSHLFDLFSYYKSCTSSTTTYSTRLNCYILYSSHIIFVEKRSYSYAGKHGDYELECGVKFHTCSLTDDLISTLNKGLANLMKKVSDKSEDLPRKRSLLELLKGYVDEERWNLECIFELKQSYECGSDDDSS